jgi:hypothetical protein
VIATIILKEEKPLVSVRGDFLKGNNLKVHHPRILLKKTDHSNNQRQGRTDSLQIRTLEDNHHKRSKPQVKIAD